MTFFSFLVLSLSACSQALQSEHIDDTHESTWQAKSEAYVDLKTDSILSSGKESILEFKVLDKNGNKENNLVVSHDKLFHVVIISEQFDSFSHIHPEDSELTTEEMRKEGIFKTSHVFEKAGKHIIAVDYATKEGHFAKQFIVDVEGIYDSSALPMDFSREKIFEGYAVRFLYSPEVLKAGKDATLVYYIRKDGQPVNDITPYLAAPMHIAIVKEDLSAFMHTHGEVHKNGAGMNQVGMQDTHEIPQKFGPEIEAHLQFPEPGKYHVFGEFKHNEKVITTHFTVEVAE